MSHGHESHSSHGQEGSAPGFFSWFIMLFGLGMLTLTGAVLKIPGRAGKSGGHGGGHH
jgi:hypothetical protein